MSYTREAQMRSDASSSYRTLSFDGEHVAAIVGTMFVGVLFILFYLFVPKWQVPSLLPIAISACTLTPSIILILLKARDPLDIWSVFVYTALLAFVVAPLIHLLTDRTLVRNLDSQFEPLMRFVAWTSVPVVPLFYFAYRAGQRRNKSSVFANPKKYIAVRINHARRLSLILILLGTVAQVLFYTVYRTDQGVISTGILTRTAGTVLLLADLGNVGVLLFVYTWMVSRRLNQRLKSGSKVSFFLVLVACGIIVAANFLRGSRSFMLIYIVWGIVLWAQFVRPISLYVLIVIAIAGLQPLTIYKLYKFQGYTQLDALLFDSSFREEQSGIYDKNLATTVAGDFGRYYVWMLFHQELSRDGNLSFQLGRTYLASLAQPIPRWLLNDKPPGMVELTTDAEMGIGYWRTHRPSSSKVGGLWAEGYVNFWIPGIWIVCVFYGWILGRVKRFYASLPKDGLAHFFYGIVVSLVFQMVFSDSRLIIWNVVRLFIIMVPVFLFAGKPSYLEDKSITLKDFADETSGNLLEAVELDQQPLRGKP